MKPLISKIWLVFILLIVSRHSYSQIPQGFNYQAIARDNSGNPITNATLQVKLAVMPDSLGSTIYWEELFNPVTTNAYGLFTVVLGRGTRQATSTVATFSNINWLLTPIFVRTQVYYQSAWKNMGSSRLWSVPYSLNTNNIMGTLPYLGVAGTTTIMDSALFCVRNNKGQIILAVYNEGVRIYVDDGIAKGTAKGGFAIGGFGTGKGVSQPLFIIGNDSARIYVKDQGKTAKGGFAIGGFSGSKGMTGDFVRLTPKNTLIGFESAINGTGLYNAIVGYRAGRNMTSGYQNTILGHLADSSLTTGYNNIVIGEAAGYNLTTGDNNTLIGTGSGFSHTNQEYNVMIGTSAGYHVNASGWNGSFNTFMGINAGYAIQGSRDNTFLGTNAGYWLENGRGNTFVGIDAGRAGNDHPWAPGSNIANYNTFIGTMSGRNIVNGSNNVAVGYQSGYSNTAGAGNVFIGYQAGFSETGSNLLYIANSSSNPLIYGDFSGKKIGVNTTTLDKTFNVGGDAQVSGNLTAGSISGDLTGTVNGATTGKIFMNAASGVIASINSNKLDIYWDNSSSTLTLRNTMSSGYCFYRIIKMTLGIGNTAYDAGGVYFGNNKSLFTFTNNGDACEISFGDENGASTCTMWLQWVNSKLMGHYIKY